jgi:catechol 2,3-dioxygenase-like lactoylglutathione lyase family enzyme
VRQGLVDSELPDAVKGVIEGLALGGLVLIVAYPLADLLFVQPSPGKSAMPSIVSEASAGSRLVASDMPQAIAWYARRPAMLFVHHPNDYHNLRKAGMAPDTVFLTPTLQGYPPEELVSYWQGLITNPEPFAGYVPDWSWQGLGKRWRWKGGPGTEGTPPVEGHGKETPEEVLPN